MYSKFTSKFKYFNIGHSCRIKLLYIFHERYLVILNNIKDVVPYGVYRCPMGDIVEELFRVTYFGIKC